MKILLTDLKKSIPGLKWKPNEIAEKLSLIGFETEVFKDYIDITLTANRRRWTKEMILFDLVGCYDLKSKNLDLNIILGEKIPVSNTQINQLLGSNVSKMDLKKLEKLGFEVGNNWVRSPNFRDIETVADVAEELFRLLGAAEIISQPLSKQTQKESKAYEFQQQLKNVLVRNGFTETATSSFAKQGSRQLKNPFTADEPYLRPRLLEGLLHTVAKNPYLKPAAFFELGEVYNPQEETQLGIILAGYKNPYPIIEQISNLLQKKINFEEVDEKTRLTTSVKTSKVFYAQLPIEGLKPSTITTSTYALPNFKPISKFPPLTRDFTLVNSKTPTESIVSGLKSHFTPTPLIVELIDTYRNPVTNDQSRTFRVLFQKMGSSFTQPEIETISQHLESWLKRV